MAKREKVVHWCMHPLWSQRSIKRTACTNRVLAEFVTRNPNKVTCRHLGCVKAAKQAKEQGDGVD